MKKQSRLVSILMSILLNVNATAQNTTDTTGMAGDQFNLYGAMEAFRSTKNTWEFEREINDSKNKINNLDLNKDGKVDYVRVLDKSKGVVKILVLQALLAENNSKDIAVIEIEKNGKESAVFQIVGDEELYGKNYILEPKTEKQLIEDPENELEDKSDFQISIWSWPIILWLYSPDYTYWNSPYYWTYYPEWWSPWNPLSWDVYYPYWSYPHHRHYHRVNSYASPKAHRIYYGHRESNRSKNTSPAKPRNSPKPQDNLNRGRESAPSNQSPANSPRQNDRNQTPRSEPQKMENRRR